MDTIQELRGQFG